MSWRSAAVGVAVAAWSSVPLALLAGLGAVVDLGTLAASIPRGTDTLHHGVLVWWPAAVALLGVALRPAWRFLAMVFTRDNGRVGARLVVPGLLGYTLIPGLIGRPSTALIGVPVLVAASGWAVRRWLRSEGEEPGPWLAVGWSMTWRTIGMVLPLYVAFIVLILAIGLLPAVPGLAFLSALSEEPARAEALPSSLGLLAPLLPAYAVLLLVAMLPLAAVWVFGAITFLPGHIARRARAQGAFGPRSGPSGRGPAGPS